jgi:hypothetical protein
MHRPQFGRFEAGARKNLTPAAPSVLFLFVTASATMSERHTAILARLADAGERLAMKHAERALAADDPDIEARATAAFHRAARSVRQCLALEAKLTRDAARAEREDRDDDARKASAHRDRRRLQVRAAVGRLIWTEAENETEAERFTSDLDDLLELEEFSEGFADETLDAQVTRLARALGLLSDDETAEIVTGTGADPGDRAPQARRSSA